MKKVARIKLQVNDVEIDFNRSAGEVLRRVKEVERKYGGEDSHLVDFVSAVMGEFAKYWCKKRGVMT